MKTFLIKLYTEQKVVFYFSLGILFLTFGYEMANCTLSIDEEIYAAGLCSYISGIREGRWGTAILLKLFPFITVSPVLPTFLFAAGLLFSVLVISRLLTPKLEQKLIFAALFCTSPIWPHIAEFNTIAWETGIGLILACLAIYLAATYKKYFLFGAIFFLALAVAIYQSFVIFYTTLCLILMLKFFISENSFNLSKKVIKSFALSLLGAGFLYEIVTILCNYIYHTNNEYLDNFINLHQPKQIVLSIFSKRSLEKAIAYLSGSDPIFLSYGIWYIGLFWISIFVIIFCTRNKKQIFYTTITIFFLIIVALSFIFVSAGTIPARALLGVPLLYSLVPSLAFEKINLFFKRVFILAVVMSALSNIAISNTLFHTDHLSNIQDQVMSTQVLSKIYKVAENKFGKTIPVTVFGTWPHVTTNAFKRVEIFGTSFLGYDIEIPYRMCLYFQMLGYNDLQPVSLLNVKTDFDYIAKQPSWPREGSVFLCNNVVVVKLSEITNEQYACCKK